MEARLRYLPLLVRWAANCASLALRHHGVGKMSPKRLALAVVVSGALASGGTLLPQFTVLAQNTPTTLASGSQTAQYPIPGGTIYVTFTTPSAAAIEDASGYAIQYASVEMCPNIGGCSSWNARVYGDWEYNGTYAYTYSGPNCAVTDYGPYTCNPYGNGARMPGNMTWKMVGTADTGWYAGCTYSIAIYFWGNGTHSVSTCACGLCS